MFKFIDIPKQDLNKIYEITEQSSHSQTKFLALEGGEAPKLTFPHETFTIGLSSLVNQQTINPQKTGIRVIEALRDSFNSIIDVNKGGEGGSQPQLFLDKKFIGDYEQAFGNIMDSGMEQENYAVRTLKVPALYVDALWLHDNDDESNDRYLPVRSMNLFENNRLYSKVEFFEILRKAAKNYNLDDPLLGG
jgi:hypothetical protein